jgi:hypothetical protein
MDDNLKKEVVKVLKTILKDAEMALSGEWDCTTVEGIETGFGSQIDLIENLLEKIEE